MNGNAGTWRPAREAPAVLEEMQRVFLCTTHIHPVYTTGYYDGALNVFYINEAGFNDFWPIDDKLYFAVPQPPPPPQEKE